MRSPFEKLDLKKFDKYCKTQIALSLKELKNWKRN